MLTAVYQVRLNLTSKQVTLKTSEDHWAVA